MILHQVSGVIPLHPAHDRHLEGLFTNLLPQDDVLGELIIVRSQCKPNESGDFGHYVRGLASAQGLRTRVRILTIDSARTAGQNRNRGLREAGFEWTLFMDADDLYHPHRARVMVQTAHQYHADLVLHSYESLSDDMHFEDLSNSDPEIVTGEALRRLTFPDGRRVRWAERLRNGGTNIHVPESMGPICQGHTLVRTVLRDEYSFGRSHRGEDGQFNRDVLWNRRNVVFVNACLSRYRPENSTLSTNPVQRAKWSLISRLERLMP